MSVMTEPSRPVVRVTARRSTSRGSLRELTRKYFAHERKWQDAAAKHGMHCWVFLRELASIDGKDSKRDAMLRKVVAAFKDHPGMGVWKGADEPEWGKLPVPPLVRAREIIRELDTNHPVAVTHAPRGTVATLRLIGERPEVRAAELAVAAGRERLPFKTDVRKLKELGLTESLEVGYRLSPRGRALLERLGESRVRE